MPGPFEHPFLAEVYGSVPSHQNRPDIPFYTRLAAECPGCVLELGSGTGRVLIPIAKAGKSVWGLESSAHMLARCREFLDSGSQKVRENVKLVQGQMQSFELRGQFGLVICPFNSFLHLLTVEEQLSCLTCVHEHLLPGGKFAFDVFDPDIKRMTSARFTGAGKPQRFELPTGSKIELQNRNKSVDFLGQRIEGEINLDIAHPDGRSERVIHPIWVRYLFGYEAEHLLVRSGFEVEALYGDFHGSPHGAVYPGSLVLVAKKR